MALSECNTTTDLYQRELVEHGDVAFPIACYADDLNEEDVPWHWHDEWEFAIVTEGFPTFLLENTKHVLSPGDGIFITSRALHAVDYREEAPCRLHSAVFHPRLIGGAMDSRFWQELVQPLSGESAIPYTLLSPHIPWQQEILRAFEKAWQCIADEPEDYANQMRYELSRGIRILIQNSAASRRELSLQERTDAQRIRSMLTYIDEHYYEDLTIKDLSNTISVSPSVCIRCFHQMLGTTPIQYIKQLRLQKAAQMLEHSSRSVKDIAMDCGFNDVSYFTKAFREKYECTPKQYRFSRQ